MLNFTEDIPMRRKIFLASVKLFSDRGYDQVSLKEIAKECGIRAASIYNHYESKADILDDIYTYFINIQNQFSPDMEEILSEAETGDVFSLLNRTLFYYDADYSEMMDRIILIAAHEMRNDEKSQSLIRDHMFALPHLMVGPLLNRLIEIGRIEPMDVNAFVQLMENLCFATAVRNFSFSPISLQNWNDVMSLVFSTVKLTGK